MAKNRMTRPRASVYEHMIYTVFRAGKSPCNRRRSRSSLALQQERCADHSRHWHGTDRTLWFKSRTR